MTLGSWQQYKLNDMLSDRGCSSATHDLRGKAKASGRRYAISFDNLLEKLKKAGYHIRREPGKYGGESGARYFAIEPPSPEMARLLSGPVPGGVPRLLILDD